jgi:hypothetical protein
VNGKIRVVKSSLAAAGSLKRLNLSMVNQATQSAHRFCDGCDGPASISVLHSALPEPQPDKFVDKAQRCRPIRAGRSSFRRYRAS